MGKFQALACNLSAIAVADRTKYKALVARFRAAIRGRREVSKGYVYTLDSQAISLLELAEWMGMESLCCPFLTMRLSVVGGRTTWLLAMTGPSGAKTILQEEF